MPIDFTTVLGVDLTHLKQLELVWPTWIKHKPSLLEHPLVIFYDKDQLTSNEIARIVGKHSDITFHSWPPDGVEYEGDETNKFLKSQRYKMLSGFVYVPAKCVKTTYWLKLDCDVVATGKDNWIDESWFDGTPVIIAQKWSFTKPANQMMLLDKWVEDNPDVLYKWSDFPPLNLVPKSGWSRVGHKRIISWCGFFNTEFTKVCSEVAEKLCGIGKLPVMSQDGFMWYLAKRGQFEIKRVGMKSLGWKHCSSERSINKAIDVLGINNGK